MLTTLLQTKGFLLRIIQLLLPLFSIVVILLVSLVVELDATMLDALGILPQRKQNKKLLLVIC